MKEEEGEKRDSAIIERSCRKCNQITAVAKAGERERERESNELARPSLGYRGRERERERNAARRGTVGG